MFHSRTLFVVGAVASCEAGLPAGIALKKIIARKLNASSGDEEIREALQRHARNNNSGVISKLLDAADSIRTAMPQALSIDNYLDAHRGNFEVDLVGKVAIAKAILEAEMSSFMYFDTTREEGPPSETIFATWYNRFFQALTEGRSKDQLDGIFDLVSFITFNYDRCIEHFLTYSLRNYYRITEQQSRDILNTMKIFHPYGMVGTLGPHGLDRRTLGFGGLETTVWFGETEPDLLKLVEHIKTFNERIHEETMLNAMRDEVEKAEVIVFLGFAFHPQNMELISSEKPGAAKRIFATAKGISKSDCGVIAGEFSKVVKQAAFELNIRNDLTCVELFDEYWRSLTRL